MKCPVCRVEMIVVEIDSVEIDHCVECSGVWFDLEELDYMLANLGLKAEGLLGQARPATPEATGREKKRKCPRCRWRKMEKVLVSGEDAPIMLDRCMAHGHWFDGGELPGVLRARLPEGEWKKTIEFLGGFFSLDAKEEEETI